MNDLLMARSFSRVRDGGDLEFGVEMQGVDTAKCLAPFFDDKGVIENEMEIMKRLLVKLKDANEEGKAIHKAVAVKALRDRMDQDVREVSKIAKSIKDKLEKLDMANLDSRKTEGCEEGSATDRTRIALTNTLRKKLKEMMKEFSALKEKIMGEYKETIERRYFAVTGTKPDGETLDHIIETGQSETFLQKAIQEQGRGQVIETIREIQERHDGVKQIEKDLLALNQIFLDMALLVEAQGEQLDDIELNMKTVESFTDRANKQLLKAKRHQRRSRKWTCIGLIGLMILLILILVITLPILKSAGVI